jgi:S1-C subfamily serine protease
VVPVDGPAMRRLNDALRTAFFPPRRFEQFLHDTLDISLPDITMAGDYTTIVSDVLREARAAGWLEDLVAAAREVRPQNAGIVAAARDLGMVDDRSALERILNTSLPEIDSEVWLARYGELEGQVCRIETATGGPIGTGFLVGPGRCLTNHHVIDGRDPAAIRLRFDYRRAANGRDLYDGTICRLAEPWFEALSPPSPLDLLPDTGGSLPAPDQLDIAVLTVAGSPGNRPVGRGAEAPDAPSRGWIRMADVPAAPGDALFVLQHPAGEPLKLAVGSVIDVNVNGTRLRHRANTRPGSSGSPCFNARLELVGVHHAGDPLHESQGPPRYNSAVPAPAILSWLSGRKP